MLFQRHLKIQAGVFGQMSGRVAIFCSENRTNFVHPFEIGGNTHLLWKLGRLCKESWPSEIIDFEDCGSRFRGTTLKLRGVDFNKAFAIEIGAEEIADSRLDSED